MSARFMTAILAIGALIATVSAAPARADSDDLKRFVGAAAGLYILGQAIEHGKVETVNHREHRYQRPWNDQDKQKGHARQKGHGKRAWQRPPLPRHCLRQVGGRHKSWYALSSHCLSRSYPAALPRACQTRAWYKGNSRPVYGIGCLQGRGYHLSRR